MRQKGSYEKITLGCNRRFSVPVSFFRPCGGAGRSPGGAEYGVGNHRADVTPQVRSFIHDGVLDFDLSDQNLGVDPAHGHVKELFIRIQHWDRGIEEFSFREGTHVRLELDPDRGYEWHDREFHIMRAYYGGGGHFVNVTDLLRSMKHDGRLFVVVDNRSMGGDPDPDVHKVLRVLYWHDGERRQVVVPEHAELRLP
jgi:hypothetical protein